MKKLFQKPFVKNFVLPIIRGASKSIPGVGTGIELITNITHEFGNKETEQAQPRPHNYWSIGVQVICIGAIIYAFYTKTISIDDLLRLIGQISE